MASFPESCNIQTESLKGVLVVKVLLKENSFKIQFQHFYRRAQNATGCYRIGWDGTGWDGHLHVEELDGDVPVPVACMHCRESTRPNLVAEPEKGKL